MKLAWQVATSQSDVAGNNFVGYGDTPHAALQDLLAKIDQWATMAQENAATVTAAMVRVRGEVEALGDA